MREQVLDEAAMEALLAERPVTITMHLSTAEVELALSSGGATLRQPVLIALMLARVLDTSAIETWQ